MSDPLKLTKKDTVALWHAVGWMDLCLKQSAIDGESADALEAERGKLRAAKRALRKVNAIRKHQGGSVAALRAQPEAAGPVGWQLVPREPTPEMLAAMDDAGTRAWGDDCSWTEYEMADVYAAMLAAASQPSKEA